MSFKKLTGYADYMDRNGHPMVANAIDMACQASVKDYNKALGNLKLFALLLDADGFTVEADFLNTYLNLTLEKKAELPDASEKYNAKTNNESGFFTALTDEANKEPEVEIETWKSGGHALLTRYSPDYPGVMMLRISDGVYQDLLSKKVYDFKSGFISDTGERYYGGSVSYQTPTAQNYLNSPQIMDSQHLRVRPR